MGSGLPTAYREGVTMRSSRKSPPDPDDPDSRLDKAYLDPDIRVEPIGGEVPELVTIDAFGHRFEDLDPDNAADLLTLEREQAIYGQFWDDSSGVFRHYRVPFRATEVVTYVETEVARQEFHRALRSNPNATLRELLASLADQDIARRVVEYGVSDLRDGTRLDIRGCPASFMPGDLEDLVCGLRKERYEPLPRLGGQEDRVALVANILATVRILATYLSTRRRGKDAFVVADEYDVQDLLYVALRGVFPSARREDPAPAIASPAKWIDIVIPEIHAVIEVKFVRDRNHAARIADELKIDFESYHSHPDCEHLFALVYDPGRHIRDPEQLSRALNGRRTKDNHLFTVYVTVV
jgi:REase_DpnII-MboI